MAASWQQWELWPPVTGYKNACRAEERPRQENDTHHSPTALPDLWPLQRSPWSSKSGSYGKFSVRRMTPITLLLLCMTSGLSRGHPGPQNQVSEVGPQPAWRMTPIALSALPGLWPLQRSNSSSKPYSWGKPQNLYIYKVSRQQTMLGFQKNPKMTTWGIPNFFALP